MDRREFLSSLTNWRQNLGFAKRFNSLTQEDCRAIAEKVVEVADTDGLEPSATPAQGRASQRLTVVKHMCTRVNWGL